MMTTRTWFAHLTVDLLIAACVLPSAGCGHRQSSVPVATGPQPVSPTISVSSATQPILASITPASSTKTAPVKTYRCPIADIQFDYPADWEQDKAKTAVFAISPTLPSSSVCSLNLDVPKLPWHPPGMISVGMVADGYEDDLKKNQMHDAVQQEDCSLNIPGAKARRITSTGHADGKTLIDIAVILIHADRVYILSADCDENTKDNTRKTLDSVVASLKWTK